MTLYQVDYTSRDYDSLRADLIKVVQSRIPQWAADDPADFALALVESFAYMGDVMSYYLDRVANEANLQTATQKGTLLNFAEVIGYKPSGPTPAGVTLAITNNTALPIDLPVGTQAAATLDKGPFTTAYYETITPITNLAAGATISVDAVEGKTVGGTTPIIVGTSEGYAYTEVTLPDTGIIDTSIVVYVGQSSALTRWTYTDNIIQFGPNDKVYTTRLNENGTTNVRFGDGIYGAVPTAGYPISATYRTSVGTSGNVASGKIKTISYIPGSSVPTSSVGVVSTTDAFGGTDGENIAALRRNLKAAFQTRNRAVTLNDYAALAGLVPGVGQASAVSDVYTSVTLYVQPFNDGTDTPGVVSGVPTSYWDQVAAGVETYLANRIPVNTGLTILPPSYVDIDIAVNLTIGDAYSRRDTEIAAAKALLDPNNGTFSYINSKFGADVTQSNLIATLMAVPGVQDVSFTTLALHGGSGVANIAIGPDEIAILQAANLGVVASGGIA